MTNLQSHHQGGGMALTEWLCTVVTINTFRNLFKATVTCPRLGHRASLHSKHFPASLLRKLGQQQQKEVWRRGGDTEPWNIMECFPDLWCLQTSMIITHNNSTGNTCYVGQNRLHCQYLERWAVCERNTPTPRKS